MLLNEFVWFRATFIHCYVLSEIIIKIKQNETQNILNILGQLLTAHEYRSCPGVFFNKTQLKPEKMCLENCVPLCVDLYFIAIYEH